MLSSAVALAVALSLAPVPEALPDARAVAWSSPGLGLASPSAAAPSSTSPPIAAPPPTAAPPPSAAPPSASPPIAAPPPSSPPPSAPPSTAPSIAAPPPAAAPPTAAPPEAAPGDAPAAAPPPSPGPAGDVTTPPPSGEPAADLTHAPADAPADVAAATDAWSDPEPEPAAQVTVPQKQRFVPRVPPPPEPPTGRGLLIGAAVLGGAGIIVRIATTVSVSRAMQLPNGLPMDTMLRGAIIYDPLIAAGLALAGGGMARRGRHDAHLAVFEGTPPTRARRKKLGWALFGAGLGAWAVTRISGGSGCRGSDDCKARVWEVGYYVSLAGTVPGVILGGYASGYDGYRRRFEHVGIAPIANRHTQMWGMAVNGRF